MNEIATHTENTIIELAPASREEFFAEAVHVPDTPEGLRCPAGKVPGLATGSAFRAFLAFSGLLSGRGSQGAS